MCTAVSFRTRNHYFGRNLDYEYSYQETVTITPRNFPLSFRKAGGSEKHYAMIGMAFVQNDYPLYYDATNEKGLSVAGLNFPKNAVYLPFDPKKKNIAPFEFIPYLLCDCASVEEARKKLDGVNLWSENFSPELPHSPLHWMISDSKESIVAEPTKEGLKIYENPVGILTNNPPFEFHLMNLNNYMSLSCADPQNNFSDKLPLAPYSRGMGGLGLPGDLSSASRFIKAAFTRCNSLCGDSETESVNQFFHILTSVEQQKGCCKVEHGYEYTIYSSCCNTDKGIYYYTTYLNRKINGVDLHAINLDSSALFSYPLLTEEISIQNKK